MLRDEPVVQCLGHRCGSRASLLKPVLGVLALNVSLQAMRLSNQSLSPERFSMKSCATTLTGAFTAAA